METKGNFWQRLGIQDWFLTNETSGINGKTAALTPDVVYKYIINIQRLFVF